MTFINKAFCINVTEVLRGILFYIIVQKTNMAIWQV